MDQKRVVVKIGTGVLVGKEHKLNHAVIRSIVRQLSELHQKGFELILVSSGAVGAGREIMSTGVKGRSHDDRIEKKMLAAIGQARLMQLYRDSFDISHIPVAQLLLLRQDFHDRERYLSIRTILEKLLEERVIPILNENDPLSSSDLCFSDNDNLAALVALALKADHLIILSDVPGLYTGNPSRHSSLVTSPDPELIACVPEITPQIKSYCSKSISSVGMGGMINKIMAIEMVTRSGIAAHLCYGRKENAILDCLRGKNPGTWFLPQKTKAGTLGKKAWLAGGVVPSGAIVVDAGALKALQNHKSLLAVGIKSIVGSFKKGDVVSIFDEEKVPHGTGLVAYGSQRLAKLESAGPDRSKMAKRLFSNAVIHVDKMVVW